MSGRALRFPLCPEMVPTVVELPAGKALTVRAAVDAFFDSVRNPNTVRSYGGGVG